MCMDNTVHNPLIICQVFIYHLLLRTLRPSMMFWRCYGVIKYGADAILRLAAFSLRFWLKSDKMYKNKDHTRLLHCIII